MKQNIPVGHAEVAPRLPGLDLLRAVAISWVMLYHAGNFDLVSDSSWPVAFGWMGVDLFFVLSGFLIAGQLLRPWARGQMPNYRRFMGRRVLRTLPAYLAVVVLYFSFPALWDRPHIQPLWQFLTFTENLLIDPSVPKAFSQVWSLCVEEQFYLLLPVTVALVALRPSTAKVVVLIAAVLVVGAALRGYLWLHDVAHAPVGAGYGRVFAYMRKIYYPTWTRLDGLLAGVVIAAIQTFRPALWSGLTARPNLLLILGLVGVGISIPFFKGQFPGVWPAVFGYPILAFSMAAMVAAGSERRSWIGRYRVPGATALATGAYSLYLTHKIVFHAVRAATAHAPPPVQALSVVVAFLAAFAVGAALYWIVERPFLKLRDRLDGRSRSSLALAPARRGGELQELV